MKILFWGDIVGRSGRDAVIQQNPKVKKQYGVDFVIANGENAAAGFGLTAEICRQLWDAQVNVITTGNHVWDNRDILSVISTDTRLIRPLNFPKGSVGNGFVSCRVGSTEIVIINAIGRVFMDLADDPFAALDLILQKFPLGSSQNRVVIVDFHAEATSEKLALAYHFDGKVSAVLGTHTHVPTADARVLPRGTGYQTDVGMCGDYHSILGFKIETVIPKFLKLGPTKRKEVAEGPATLCGVILDIDPVTGLTKTITPLQVPKI